MINKNDGNTKYSLNYLYDCAIMASIKPILFYNIQFLLLTDNGCRIEKQELSKIFSLFHSSKPKNLIGGIGLSYAERVVRFHHGDIEVKSQVVEYTTFTVVLPALRRLCI